MKFNTFVAGITAATSFTAALHGDWIATFLFVVLTIVNLAIARGTK